MIHIHTKQHSQTPEIEAFKLVISQNFSKLDTSNQTSFKVSRIKNDTLSHNLLFSRNSDGKKICVISKDVTGTGTFGTVYNAILVTEESNNVWLAEEVVDKKIRITKPLKPNNRRVNFISRNNTSMAPLEHHESRSAISMEESKLQQLKTLKGVIEFDDKIHLILEKTPGQNLYTTLRNRNFTLDEKYQIAVNFLVSLMKFHQLGFSHNDLKEQNLHITDDLQIHLVDFGTALHTSDRLLHSGMGTQYYQSPQCIHGGVNGKTALLSDLYSAGVVLLNLFSRDKDDLLARKPFIRNLGGAIVHSLQPSSFPKAESLLSIILRSSAAEHSSQIDRLKQACYEMQIVIDGLTKISMNERCSLEQALKQIPRVGLLAFSGYVAQNTSLKTGNAISDYQVISVIKELEWIYRLEADVITNFKLETSSAIATFLLEILSKPRAEGSLGIITSVNFDLMTRKIELMVQDGAARSSVLSAFATRFHETLTLKSTMGPTYDYIPLLKSISLLKNCNLVDVKSEEFSRKNKDNLRKIIKFIQAYEQEVYCCFSLKNHIRQMVTQLAPYIIEHAPLSLDEQISTNTILNRLFGPYFTQNTGFEHAPASLKRPSSLLINSLLNPKEAEGADGSLSTVAHSETTHHSSRKTPLIFSKDDSAQETTITEKPPSKKYKRS